MILFDPNFGSRIRQAVMILSLLLASCGKGNGIHGIPVSGKVLKNGQPVPLSNDTLIIELVGTDGNRSFRGTAVCDPSDGSFLIRGPSQDGIPVGRYRVALFPGKAVAPGGKDYLFSDEFGEKSPLEFELTEDNSKNVIVDVGTKSVKAE